MASDRDITITSAASIDLVLAGVHIMAGCSPQNPDSEHTECVGFVLYCMATLLKVAQDAQQRKLQLINTPDGTG